MGKDDLKPVIIALAFIVLLGFIFFVTMRHMSRADDFLKVWAAVGPIVGVVTGLIPTYFFGDMAGEASKRAERQAHHAGEMRGMLVSMGKPPNEIPEPPN